MSERTKLTIPLVLFFFVIQRTMTDHWDQALWLFFLLFAYILFFVLRNGGEDNAVEGSGEAQSSSNRHFSSGTLTVLTYRGESLNFSDVELDSALQKHYPFYNRQDDSNRQVFLHRLKNFIAEKKFFIHSESGFKEMPILVSAAAIQLTFGLKKYLLTHFENIHIYPEEFMRVTHSIDFLEGNVSGHNINISWKHFLDGINDPNDGANVGLHEMAHALYYQTFVAGENVDRSFHDLYKHFIQDGNKTFLQEQHKPGSLYSEYAMRNFQEFWAESVELFFEKPEEMNLHYPSLYQTICFLLNQDPMKDHSGRS